MMVLDGQIGCYGGPTETPKIDALAANGMRSNNFHTTALCSPSRGALLTGRNHHSIGAGRDHRSRHWLPFDL